MLTLEIYFVKSIFHTASILVNVKIAIERFSCVFHDLSDTLLIGEEFSYSFLQEPDVFFIDDVREIIFMGIDRKIRTRRSMY
ncbi:MAG: hypothetical protein COY99_00720 [Candidatus Yonathbacteria bacterium CG_4_10_14_0_8_um_filter_47_645]|nr:MAG: hypothetical protein COY99_00720 [Candidatus Yonathbacteria bacterium CG_4_10_14_0_8_um_filter_47_645]